MDNRLQEILAALPSHDGAEGRAACWRPLFRHALAALHARWDASNEHGSAARAETALAIGAACAHFFLRTGDSAHAARAAKFYAAALHGGAALLWDEERQKRAVAAAAGAMLLHDGRVRVPAELAHLVPGDAQDAERALAQLPNAAIAHAHDSALQAAVLVSDTRGPGVGALAVSRALGRARCAVRRVFLSGPSYASLVAALAGVSLDCPRRVLLYFCCAGGAASADGSWSVSLSCGGVFTPHVLYALRPDASRTFVLLDAASGADCSSGHAAARVSPDCTAAAAALLGDPAGALSRAVHGV